jgi:HSP20 family protein
MLKISDKVYLAYNHIKPANSQLHFKISNIFFLFTLGTYLTISNWSVGDLIFTLNGDCDMSDPTTDPHDDEERRGRYPRRRRGRNPFDDIFENLFDQFGGVSFDDIFNKMDYFLEDLFRRFSLNSPVSDDNNPPGFVWGFRMTTGPDGRPHIERFGNNPRQMTGKTGFQPSAEREPLVDVIEDTDVVRVIAEIPGVQKENIELSATENSLLIQANSEDMNRKYYKELDLPCIIIPDSAAAKFKNGVLEVELTKSNVKERSTRVQVG